MALVPCRECGHQVSTEASACPSCGAPVVGTPAIVTRPIASRVRAGEKTTAKNPLIFAVVAVVVLWMLGTLAGGRSSTAATEPKTVDLRLAAYPGGRVLVFASGESQTLSECRYTINADGFSTGSDFTVVSVEPNGHRLLPLSELSAVTGSGSIRAPTWSISS
jgi:endogenous inhibitor of DNA gyrase (YacG/DUF329 family)